MDLTSPELVTATHALNTMSQEQQINIVAHLSETISTDELITLSQSEHKISIPSAPGPTLESKPISTDDLNTLSPNPCTPGPTPESEPNSVDELNTLSQEHEINILDIPDLSEKDSIDDDLRHSENEIESDGAGTNAQSRAGSTVPSSSHRLACRDLIDGSTAEYMEICVPLHEAAITGNWKAAKVIFDERPELVGFSITAYGDTPLHIAVSAEPTPETENFTENLVSRMEMTDLEIENDASDYAFNVVVVKGSVKMLEVMLNKHITLLDISPLTTWNGLGATTRYGNHDMAWYFYNIPEAKMLGWSWKDRQRCSFFIQCLNGDMLDVALKVVLTGNLKISESINTWTASLEILARRPDAFSRTEIGSIWRITQSFLAFFHLRKGYPDMDNYALKLLKIIVKSFPGYNTPDEILSIYPIPYTNVEIPYQVESPDQVKRKTTSQLIVLAAEEGNTRFVIELLKTFPYLVWATNDDNQSIFHIAVMHRHIGIYNLLYEIGAKKDIIMANVTDEMENSILHLVGNTSKDTQFLTVSEASLLMQRELLWFKVHFSPQTSLIKK
ncbi:uncharacterized protein [Rutidosis leptorrhynchoides]|uniref:uncharacterized protein isoform X2 n=1 Tax=Rutidosis leptorrhynchoides TaxID=125765 RepID=UPI003A994F7B